MAPNHVFKYSKCVQTQKRQYLFISEAFGAIGMHNNSLVPKSKVKSKICPKKKLWTEIMLPPTQATRCNFGVVSQFSTHCKVPRMCRKLRNHAKIAPGGLCRRQNIFVIFSENHIFFLKKSGKIQKNCKNSKKIKNEPGVMYCLIYIFFRFYY